METTLQLQNYYAQLLSYQYLGKPKAYATILAAVAPFLMAQTSTQDITFSDIPTSGVFTLSYNGNSTININWNDPASTIQTDLQALTGLASITVTGSIGSGTLTVTFTGVIPPALSLVVETSSLEASGSPVAILVTETDLVLPLAVQNAYNLTVEPYAVGVQLDVLGKYAGVTRNGVGFTGQPITLDDSDFLTLIKIAIIQNSAGSSLYTIVNNIFSFFGTQMLVFDFADMRMTYLISTGVGSSDLLQVFVTEGLLPHPMAVQVSVIAAPIIDQFFGFITYVNPTQPPITRPLNDYTDYQMDWPWLSYQDAFDI